MLYCIDASLVGIVAQLVRAPACHVGGRGFESRQSRFFPTILQVPLSERLFLFGAVAR